MRAYFMCSLTPALCIDLYTDLWANLTSYHKPPINQGHLKKLRIKGYSIPRDYLS